jgi:tRNA pseudouridine(55) synthase
MEPSGVLLLDKPAGMTSHDCVGRIRRLYNTKKVGHTGTLDPMATGVLPILVGRAAKAAEYVVSDDKIYRAGLKLGILSKYHFRRCIVLKTAVHHYSPFPESDFACCSIVLSCAVNALTNFSTPV